MSNARLSILQARAVKDRRVTDAQLRTLAALGMYADEDGWCYPMLATLGNDLGKSKQAVGRDTIALRKLGYLEVQARYDENGGRRSSMYRLKFDLPPVNMDDSTPSTSEVDTPSTSEVDVNDPSNDPIKKDLSLTGEEIAQANRKVDAILSFAKKGIGMWKGRELFNDNVLYYADWYFNKTGQIPTARTKKAWIKAFSEWLDEGLSVEDLEQARLARLKWKEFIADPNELTKDASAIRAQKSIAPDQVARPTGTGFYA